MQLENLRNRRRLQHHPIRQTNIVKLEFNLPSATAGGVTAGRAFSVANALAVLVLTSSSPNPPKRSTSGSLGFGAGAVREEDEVLDPVAR